MMNKTIAASLSIASMAGYSSQMDEIRHQVNENILIVSVYSGAIHKFQKGRLLEAEVSEDVQPGDMLLMFVSTSGGLHRHVPYGFDQVLTDVKRRGDLAMYVYKKTWNHGDPLVYEVKKNARNYFVTLITIRGAGRVVGIGSEINTASGRKGRAIAPSIKSQPGGAVLNAYVYDDPHSSTVLNSETLVSYKNGDDGIAIGVRPTHTRRSGQTEAYNGVYKKGGGDEIATSVSIF